MKNELAHIVDVLLHRWPVESELRFEPPLYFRGAWSPSCIGTERSSGCKLHKCEGHDRDQEEHKDGPDYTIGDEAEHNASIRPAVYADFLNLIIFRNHKVF